MLQNEWKHKLKAQRNVELRAHLFFPCEQVKNIFLYHAQADGPSNQMRERAIPIRAFLCCVQKSVSKDYTRQSAKMFGLVFAENVTAQR